MTIRPATLDDVEGIAKVHVDAWRSTYRGIMPDAFLDSLSYERRAEQRRTAMLERAGKEWSHVAEDDDGRIIGFALGGRERDGTPGFDGELYAIYLLDEYRGRGIGRELTLTIARDLAANGMLSLLVWVLADNPSKRFYERLGAVEVTRKMMVIGGVELEEIGYGWKELGGMNYER